MTPGQAAVIKPLAISPSRACPVYPEIVIAFEIDDAAAAVALRLFDLPRELNVSGIILGKTQYGKAENRVVRIYRDTPRHEIRDVNVSTCLRGDFSAAHLAGDQSDVLPTDTQKQTVSAYAKEKGISSIEDYGLELARHSDGPGSAHGRDQCRR